MKKISNYKLLGLIAVLAFALPAVADVVAAPTTTPAVAPVPAPVVAETEKKPVTYNEELQKKYNLSPEQMKALADSNLPQSQFVKVAQLAKSSDKSIDDILKMRLEQKMGWGKIAKTLGVHPGELGRAENEMKPEKNGKHESRGDKKKDHAFKDNSHGKKNK